MYWVNKGFVYVVVFVCKPDADHASLFIQGLVHDSKMLLPICGLNSNNIKA